jgi:hypothetical protein
VGIANDVAKLDAEVGRVEIPTDRILAIIFNPALTRQPPGDCPDFCGRRPQEWDCPPLRAWAGFRDGSCLLATELILREASLRITADGQTWNAPADSLAFLQPLGGRAVYLSDLKPAEYHQTPFLDLSWPHHADRNVTGGRLRCGGRLFLKGLGVHSKAQLVYDLTGVRDQRSGVRGQKGPPLPLGEGLGVRATHFCAEIGIDDSTAGQGSVQFRVLIDGQEKFASKTIRGGDPPMPISVELTGAKRLELLVDYADHADILDHADWLNARLIRD